MSPMGKLFWWILFVKKNIRSDIFKYRISPEVFPKRFKYQSLCVPKQY